MTAAVLLVIVLHLDSWIVSIVLSALAVPILTALLVKLKAPDYLRVSVLAALSIVQAAVVVQVTNDGESAISLTTVAYALGGIAVAVLANYGIVLPNLGDVLAPNKGLDAPPPKEP